LDKDNLLDETRIQKDIYLKKNHEDNLYDVLKKTKSMYNSHISSYFHKVLTIMLEQKDDNDSQEKIIKLDIVSFTRSTVGWELIRIQPFRYFLNETHQSTLIDTSGLGIALFGIVHKKFVNWKYYKTFKIEYYCNKFKRTYLLLNIINVGVLTKEHLTPHLDDE